MGIHNFFNEKILFSFNIPSAISNIHNGAAKLSNARVGKVFVIKSKIEKLFQGQLQDLRWSRGGKLILARSQKCLFFTGNIPSCGIGCVDSDREIERCSILLSSSRD